MTMIVKKKSQMKTMNRLTMTLITMPTIVMTMRMTKRRNQHSRMSKESLEEGLSCRLMSAMMKKTESLTERCSFKSMRMMKMNVLILLRSRTLVALTRTRSRSK